MKKIRLKQIHLINFKGIHNLMVDFQNDITDIRGGNGTGKTTIFDAFTWLLFGKDSSDRKNFNIKTLGSDGKPIQRLPHEVSAVIEVLGDTSETITLCRRYTEKWVKKRGSATEEFTGHEEERLYNEVPMSVKDWQEKIDALCEERVFKYITNPLYFSSQKKDLQRVILFRLAGDISDEQIAEGNEEFKALLSKLTGKTMEEYKREIAAKKRRIKSEVETIPDRIDERKRDTIQEEDWEKLEQQLKKLQSDYDGCVNLFSQEGASAAADENVLAVQKEIAQCKEKMLHRELEIKSELLKAYEESVKKQRNLKLKVDSLRYTLRSTEKAKEDAAKQLVSLQAQRLELIDEWHSINDDTLSISETDFICPTCGRRYDISEIAARKEELVRNFNLKKAQLLEENTKKGKKIKAMMIDAETSVNFNAKKIEEVTADIDNLIKDPIFSEELSEPDATQKIAEDKMCRDISKEIKALTERLQAKETQDDAPKDKLNSIGDEISEIKARLAKKEIIEQNNTRIAELENSLRELSQELADLESVEFTLEQFSKARVTAIERKINNLFRFVKFKMFEQQINGGEAETCVATVDGVPFEDLNNAMKIAAGLDIIGGICVHEGIYAPIFIDNAESINYIPKMDSQIIKLTVSNDSDLIISDNSNNLFN